MFDFHHDSVDSHCLSEIRAIRNKLTVDGLVHLCERHLGRNDDDWLKAGMELGIFGDVVIFGVNNMFDRATFRQYRDHLGLAHTIEMVGWPRQALAYQGELSDPTQSTRTRSSGIFWPSSSRPRSPNFS